MLGMAASDAAGYPIPFIAPLVGLIYLCFIPGAIVLRIFKLHRLGTVQVLLYSIGMSIAFLMFLGFFINLLYPYIGISRPISTLPLIITITLVLSILCFIAYIRDRRFSEPTRFNLSSLLSPPALFLLLLPILAVLGAQLVNFYQSNLLLMILMVLLALVPLLLAFTRHLPERLYPLAIIMVALSLILHRSLISPYLWGADIISEYACFRTVVMNGFWTSSSPNLIPAYNATLSVTILPAILTSLLSIDGLWVFKLIFPLSLSLVPLAMYQMLREQFGKKTAFLSAFFLMSMYLFYTVFPGVDKQLIATLFLALFAMLMVDKSIGGGIKTALLSVFGIALIVSHYSTAFLLVIIVPAALVFLYLLRRRSAVLTISLAAILITVTFTWYLLQSDGAVVKQFIGMGETAVTMETATPDAETITPTIESHRMIAQGSENLPDTLRHIYIFTQFLLVVGIIGFIWRWLKRREKGISDEYMAFALLFLGILGLELIIPRFSLVISLDRIYSVCLFFLAPFCILGGELLIKTLAIWLSPAFWKTQVLDKLRQVLAPMTLPSGSKVNTLTLKISAVFCAFSLLLNTGFIYELAGQPLGNSIALSQDNVDFPIYNNQEFAAAEWLLYKNTITEPDSIYYDSRTYHLFNYLDVLSEEITGKAMGTILYRPKNKTSEVITEVPAGSYIYLRSFNIEQQQLSLGWPGYQTMDVQQVGMGELGAFSTVITESSVIYSNGGARVLYTVSSYSPP